eukprot:CAMPEP_0194133746 /NCGR_PEP_ID=MMETSP0152-20130528/3784_1 /TAXON_ID=1049557 /ORGANISM="Thalassiothrix antarctica, Strain L6-D1" /LENGTH=441 /DNA_ID=CAMNT_0038829099 /DNA_START=434 /DNA_END=1760 /DNA_ORIENTATION=-
MRNQELPMQGIIFDYWCSSLLCKLSRDEDDEIPGKLKRNKDYGPILLNEKVMGSFWSLPYVNKRPYRSSDRQRNGTIITKTAIERMVREDITVEEYFDDYLEDIETPNLEYIRRLTEVADQAEKERNDRIEEKKSQKPNDLLKIEGALLQIKSKLKGCAKHFAMDYKTCKPHWRISMAYTLTRSLLGRLTCHSKYATEKRIKQVANIIDGAYTEIAASGFVDFACFSNDMVIDPLEAKIRSYLLQHFMQGDDLLRHWKLDKFMLDRLRSTGAKSTLVYFAFGGGWNSIPIPLMNIIAEAIVEKGGNLKNLRASRDFIDLLHEVLAPHAYSLCVNWQVFQQYFEDLLLTYKRLRPQILAYQSHPETIALCRSNQLEQHCDEKLCLNTNLTNSQWAGIIGRNVFNIWVSKRDFYPVAGWLLRGDWTALRRYHTNYAVIEANTA